MSLFLESFLLFSPVDALLSLGRESYSVTFIWVSLVAQMVKNPPDNAGDPGSILGLGRSPGEENGNPLQYSCLENPMDRGSWQLTVHGVAKSQTPLSDRH